MGSNRPVDEAFGHKGVFDAGATLEQRIKAKSRGGTAFADLVWKPRVLIEMKKRGEDLAKHYRQAFEILDRPRARPARVRGALQL